MAQSGCSTLLARGSDSVRLFCCAPRAPAAEQAPIHVLGPPAHETYIRGRGQTIHAKQIRKSIQIGINIGEKTELCDSGGRDGGVTAALRPGAEDGHGVKARGESSGCKCKGPEARTHSGRSRERGPGAGLRRSA